MPFRVDPSGFGLADVLALVLIAALWAFAQGMRRVRKPRRRTRPAAWLEIAELQPMRGHRGAHGRHRF